MSFSAHSIQQAKTSSLLTLEEWLDITPVPFGEKEVFVTLVEDKITIVPNSSESCSMSDLFSFTLAHISSIQKLENCEKLKVLVTEVYEKVMATLAWHNLVAKGLCGLKLLEMNHKIDAHKEKLLNTPITRLVQSSSASEDSKQKAHAEEELKKVSQPNLSALSGSAPDIKKGKPPAIEDLLKEYSDEVANSLDSTLETRSEKIIQEIKKVSQDELVTAASLLVRYSEVKEKEIDRLSSDLSKVIIEVLNFLEDIEGKEEHPHYLALFTQKITSLQSR